MAEPQDPAPAADAQLIAAARASAVSSALNALPERQQRAIRLRHFEDLSNPDIAAVLDVSVEAVESLLSRARRSLAVRLAATEG